MEGILILFLLDVIIIEHIFSKIFLNVLLKVLCKENPPFWNLKKWDSKKKSKKLKSKKTCRSSKNWERLVPCGDFCYKTQLNGHHYGWCLKANMNAKMM
jgi:hypothetical protein